MTEQKHILSAAFKYSFPVFLGYIVLGMAFGIFTIERGYPWYLASATGLIMFAGAGQFIAVGMFAAGASLAEAVLIQFVINARHLAYGLSMIRRFRSAGVFRPYLIFALTDETFALLSSLPAVSSGYFMFLVAILNQIYWNTGILIGVLAGSIIPWDFLGVSFALTALFIVLMIEQIFRLQKAAPFIISAVTAIAAVFILPGASGISLLGAMIISLGIIQLIEARSKAQRKPVC